MMNAVICRDRKNNCNKIEMSQNNSKNKTIKKMNIKFNNCNSLLGYLHKLINHKKQKVKTLRYYMKNNQKKLLFIQVFFFLT